MFGTNWSTFAVARVKTKVRLSIFLQIQGQITQTVLIRLKP